MMNEVLTEGKFQ